MILEFINSAQDGRKLGSFYGFNDRKTANNQQQTTEAAPVNSNKSQLQGLLEA